MPITFTGKTTVQFASKHEQGGPCEDPASQGQSRSISVVGSELSSPSTVEVMRQYHEHLSESGHFLRPRVLLQALVAHGAKLAPSSDGSISSLPSSPWVISRVAHPYMFRCMAHFLALGTVFNLIGLRDIAAWFRRLSQGGDCTIRAYNVDVLAQLPCIRQEIELPGKYLDTCAYLFYLTIYLALYS